MRYAVDNGLAGKPPLIQETFRVYPMMMFLESTVSTIITLPALAGCT